MRSSVTTRLFALVVAAWFSALATEFPALHSCPVHDMMASAMHGHMSPAGHDHLAPGGKPSPGHHDGRCTCLGCGCCGAVTTLPSTPPTFAFATSVVRRAAPSTHGGTVRAAAPQRRLPPAIGPPTLLGSSLT